MGKTQLLLTVVLGLTSTASLGSNEPQQKAEDMKLAPPHIVDTCGPKPNCVSSVGFDSPEKKQQDWHIEPLGYEHRTVTGQRAFEKLVEVLKAEGLVLDVSYPVITAVATTKIFGYQDDLHFILVEDQGIVHIRSESRKGHYDFGKNRRRLEGIRDQFVIN